MEFNYHINSEIDIPLYEQLIDMISADIKNGKLECGEKLPTVRELSEHCDIARGTVTRAYDELEKRGTIEKIQGRGTFVSYRQETGLSRIEAATEAIDKMLDTLQELGFSESETRIYLDLKLRERSKDGAGLKVAFIDCNYEAMSMAAEQIQALGGVEVTACHIDDIIAYPYRLNEDYDMIIVSAAHADALAGILPDKAKTVKVALRLMPSSVSSIARLAAGSRLGIICRSKRFGDLLLKACEEYGDRLLADAPVLFSEDAAAYIASKDALLVPDGWENYCSEQLSQKIRSFGKRKAVISCLYRIDDGSFISVEDAISEMRANKG